MIYYLKKNYSETIRLQSVQKLACLCWGLLVWMLIFGCSASAGGLWESLRHCGGFIRVLVHVVASGGRERGGVEQSSATHTGIRQSQRESRGLGSEEERAHHQNQ